jgi:hypothetical protein
MIAAFEHVTKLTTNRFRKAFATTTGFSLATFASALAD